MKLLFTILFSLTLATSVHADWFRYGFDAASTGTRPGSQTNHGYNVLFGPCWVSQYDTNIYNSSADQFNGDYANEPSGDWAGRMQYTPTDSCGHTGQAFLTITPPAKWIQLKYTRSNTFISCQGYECCPLGCCDPSCWGTLDNSGPDFQIRVRGFNANNQQVTTTEWGNIEGDYRQGANCSGDPLGHFCLWGTITVQSSNEDIKTLDIAGPGSPFYIDDIIIGPSVAPELPNPNQAHSDISGGIILTGTTSDHWPGLTYSATIRDINDVPLQNQRVQLNLDPMGGYASVCLFPSYYDCDSHIATLFTDANGEVAFRLSGHTTCTPLRATLLVNGLSWGTKVVSAMDLNGSGNVDGDDFSAFQGYFYNGPYCSAADYNSNNVIDGDDFSLFIGHFFDDGTSLCTYPISECGKPQGPMLRAATLESKWHLPNGIYDLAGRKLDRAPSKGIYWQVKDGLPRKLYGDGRIKVIYR